MLPWSTGSIGLNLNYDNVHYNTLYQAGTFDGIINIIVNKLTESDLQQYSPTSDRGVMAMYYGPIVTIGEWASRFLFIIGLYHSRLCDLISCRQVE